MFYNTILDLDILNELLFAYICTINIRYKTMAFEATKREWGELYAFFRLLADGYVYAGTADAKKCFLVYKTRLCFLTERNQTKQMHFIIGPCKR